MTLCGRYKTREKIKIYFFLKASHNLCEAFVFTKGKLGKTSLMKFS